MSAVLVSIVTGGSGELLRDCVASLFRESALPFEVAIVDNCAPFDVESALEGLPPVRILRNTAQLGFAANHNQVLKTATAPHVFVLNDDTVLFPGCMERLVRALEADPSLGMAGPRIWNDPDRTSLQDSVGDRFPGLARALVQDLLELTPLIGEATLRRWVFRNFHPVFRSGRVAHLGGAALMVRTAAIEQVGLMDERFGMYYEETDWCLRFRRHGWGVAAVAEAELVHLGGQSTSPRAAHWARVQRRSRDLYLRKHHPWTSRLILDLVRPPLQGLLRALARLARRRA